MDRHNDRHCDAEPYAGEWEGQICPKLRRAAICVIYEIATNERKCKHKYKENIYEGIDTANFRGNRLFHNILLPDSCPRPPRKTMSDAKSISYKCITLDIGI
jgi:hypothetical protein